MKTLAEEMHAMLEKRGDQPKRANAASGWFAVVPAKWARLVERAQADGRDGPNLIVYRTKTDDRLDHYVIPYSVTAPLLTDETAPNRANGKPRRWELTLKDGQLHVTHAPGSVDVRRFHGHPLPDGDAMYIRELLAPTADVGLLNERVRLLRLQTLTKPVGSRRPRRIVVNGRTSYERLGAVKMWVLRTADGRCESCGSEAPFVDEFGDPFPEVHHVRQLADGGPDAPDNAVAACPNCHRRLHHAADREALRTALYDKVARLLRYP